MTDIQKSWGWGFFRQYAPQAVLKTTSKSSNSIITQLVKEYTDQSRSDIKKWRDALAAASDVEDPRWVLIQDLYDNLMTDGHLMANIQIRKSAVLCNRFFIQDKNGNENNEASIQLQTDWFYAIIDMLLDAVYKKVSVIELVDPVTMAFHPVPRRNICPQLNRIYFEVGGTQFVNYTDPSFIKNLIWIHDSSPFGLFNDIIPQLIWKRNAQQVWADFSERFGIPMVTAETMESDKTKLDKLEKAMAALGQAAQAVLPAGTKITVHDPATKGDPHNVFNEQIKTTNNEISKRIVGGTMLTEDGSSRSQSEVHERTLDSKIAESDRRLIEFAVNNKVLPLLSNWGIKIKEGERFVFDRTESLSLTQQWSIVQGIMAEYEVDNEWLARNFNVPIIGKIKNPALAKTTSGNGLTANFR